MFYILFGLPILVLYWGWTCGFTTYKYPQRCNCKAVAAVQVRLKSRSALLPDGCTMTTSSSSQHRHEHNYVSQHDAKLMTQYQLTLLHNPTAFQPSTRNLTIYFSPTTQLLAFSSVTPTVQKNTPKSCWVTLRLCNTWHRTASAKSGGEKHLLKLCLTNMNA